PRPNRLHRPHRGPGGILSPIPRVQRPRARPRADRERQGRASRRHQRHPRRRSRAPAGLRRRPQDPHGGGPARAMSELSWIVALLAGFAAAWVIQALRRSVHRAPTQAELAAQEAERAAQEAERAAAAQEQARLAERCRKGDEDLQHARAELAALRDDHGSLVRKLAAADQRNLSLEERLAEQRKEMEEIQKKLAADFENLAQRILEANTQKFVVQNKESLD